MVGRVGALLLLLMLMLPLHLLARWRSGISRWPRRFLMAAGKIVGMDVTIDGGVRRDNAFYVANHISWVDILVLGGATGSAFVSKAEIARWPFLGWLAAQNDTILVSRTDRSTVASQIERLRTAMERRGPVTLFPEGTTGDGRALLPFKPALFAVLLPPPRAVCLQPVFIDYGPHHTAIAWTGTESALANVRRILSRQGRTRVRLHFLEPVEPGTYADRKAVASACRDRLEAAMQPLPGVCVPV